MSLKGANNKCHREEIKFHKFRKKNCFVVSTQHLLLKLDNIIQIVFFLVKPIISVSFGTP